MSMMCVTPARATAVMFSAVQIPPPTAIRPVTHVISIPKVPFDSVPCVASSPIREERGASLCNLVAAVLQVASKPSCHLSEGDLRFSASGCHFILRHPPHSPPAPAGSLSWSRPPAWALQAAPDGVTAFLPENPPLGSLPGLPRDTTRSSRTNTSSPHNAPYRLRKS